MTAEEIAFIEEQIEEARQLQQLPKEGQIAALCEKAGCSDALAKAHARAYLKHKWNPHPPERFKRWWEGKGYEATQQATGSAWSMAGTDGKLYAINFVSAYNCERVREVWRAFLEEQREELRLLKGGKHEIEF